MSIAHVRCNSDRSWRRLPEAAAFIGRLPETCQRLDVLQMVIGNVLVANESNQVLREAADREASYAQALQSLVSLYSDFNTRPVLVRESNALRHLVQRNAKLSQLGREQREAHAKLPSVERAGAFWPDGWNNNFRQP